jgi:peptidoglycan/LPS O-acetylase OafA/YrhL
MMPLGYLSFRFIEAPFLKLRRRYITSPITVQEAPG